MNEEKNYSYKKRTVFFKIKSEIVEKMFNIPKDSSIDSIYYDGVTDKGNPIFVIEIYNRDYPEWDLYDPPKHTLNKPLITENNISDAYEFEWKVRSSDD